MAKYTIYKKRFLEALGYLASYEKQRLIWFPNNQGLSSDFNDDWCDVFEMSNMEQAIFDDVILFNKEADQALRDLHQACEVVGFKRNTAELIDAPDMQVVREKAAIALQLVKESDDSESTEEIVYD